MTRFKTTQLTIFVLAALLLSTYSLITVAHNNSFTDLAQDQVLLDLEIRLNNKENKAIKLVNRKGKMANVTYADHDFSFISQTIPSEPGQIYTEVLISEIDNGQKIEVANPAMMTIEGKRAEIKYTEDEQNFAVKIMAQTSHTGGSIPVPPKPIPANAPNAAPTAEVAPVHPEPITAPKSAPQPFQAPIPPPAPEPKLNS